MRSVIACHIPDRGSCVQIGFDQISPSASSTRDLGTRLIVSRHRDQFALGGKAINAPLEEFEGKDIVFVIEWLRQKGLEKLCEIFKS